MLYTFFMTVLTGASLLLLFSFSSREVLTSTGADLEEEVWESVEELHFSRRGSSCGFGFLFAGERGVSCLI